MASEATNELKDELRAAGLRATASRIAVLRQLHQAQKPLSHADVVEALSAEAWDRATLYRNLIDLVDAGLAEKVELGDRVWRFHGKEHKTHDAYAHPHFVCTQCGEVACLEDVTVNLPRSGVPRSLKRRNVVVQVRGVCDACG